MADQLRGKDQDFDEGVLATLTRHLMRAAHQPGKYNARNPSHKPFREQATNVVRYLGSEDYLSLVAALDDEDTVTVIKLVKKANQNRRSEKEVDEHHNRLMKLVTGTVMVNETTPLQDFVRNGIFTDWIGQRGSAALDEDDDNVDEDKMHQQKKADKKADKKDRQIDEAVMGMTHIPGLRRLQELAGLAMEPPLDAEMGPMEPEAVPPPPPPPAGVEITVDEPMTEPPMAAPMPPRPMKSESTPSVEYGQATDYLAQAYRLVMDMKVSEYSRFCEEVEDFYQNVRKIGIRIATEED